MPRALTHYPFSLVPFKWENVLCVHLYCYKSLVTISTLLPQSASSAHSTFTVFPMLEHVSTAVREQASTCCSRLQLHLLKNMWRNVNQKKRLHQTSKRVSL